MSESKADSGSISDADLQRTVGELLDRKKAYAAAFQLGLHADRAEPFLLKALNDQRYYQNIDDYEPLRNLLNLITGAPQAAQPAIRILQLPEGKLRIDAARLLGRIATDECIESVQQCLMDPNGDLRAHTCIGISNGLSYGRASPKFRTEIFKAMAQLIKPSTGPSDDSYAPKCLIQLDLARAIPILIDDTILHVENGMLHEVLSALFAARVAIPVEKMSRLLKEVKANLRIHSRYRTYYDELLLLLALSKHPEAIPTIREALNDSTHEFSQMQAAQALCVLRGVNDPYEISERLFDTVGIEGMTTAQKAVCLTCRLGAAVSNGGLCSFFYNSGGDYSKQTLAALKEIKAERQAFIFEQALKVFGREGPSSDPKVRNAQYQKLLDSGKMERLPPDDELEQLTLSRLAYLHASEHLDDFR